jgi:hypothetical protein
LYNSLRENHHDFSVFKIQRDEREMKHRMKMVPFPP